MSPEKQPHTENEGRPNDRSRSESTGWQPVEPPIDGSGLPSELLEIRHSIDNIDAAMMYLLAERFKCTQRVGVLKARHDLPPADPQRERDQIERLRALAVSARLDPAFAEKFLAFVVDEVIRHHKAIAAGDDESSPNP